MVGYHNYQYYNEMNIQKFYGERVVKTIAYDQIKCIAVEWALYSNGRYREIVKDTDGVSWWEKSATQDRG